MTSDIDNSFATRRVATAAAMSCSCKYNAPIPVYTTSPIQHGHHHAGAAKKNHNGRFKKVTTKTLAIVDACGNKYVIHDPAAFFAGIAGPNSTTGVPAGVTLYPAGYNAANNACGCNNGCNGGCGDPNAVTVQGLTAGAQTVVRGAAATTTTLNAASLASLAAQGYTLVSCATVISNASPSNPLVATFTTYPVLASGAIGTTAVATSGPITITSPCANIPLALSLAAPTGYGAAGATGVQVQLTLSAPASSGVTTNVAVQQVELAVSCANAATTNCAQGCGASGLGNVIY